MLLPFLAAAAGLASRRPPDYAYLSRRVASLQQEIEEVQCLVLDTLLPRQRLEMQFGPPVSHVLSEVRNTGSNLVVIGMDHKKRCFLRRGVQARVESMSPYRASHGFFSSHSTTPMRGFTALDTVLVGGRRFEFVDDGVEQWPPDRPVFPARVRWLVEEKGTAAAIMLAESLGPLVSQWIELVRSTQRERDAGQLQRILTDLGVRASFLSTFARPMQNLVDSPPSSSRCHLAVQPCVGSNRVAAHACGRGHRRVWPAPRRTAALALTSNSPLPHYSNLPYVPTHSPLTYLLTALPSCSPLARSTPFETSRRLNRSPACRTGRCGCAR